MTFSSEIFGESIRVRFQQRPQLERRTSTETAVSRFVVSQQASLLPATPASEKIIIEWESNGHNGGDLAFGPDGMLYIPAGDGTNRIRP